MRYQLILSTEAAADLDQLWENDADCAADLEVIFEELEADQFMLDALTEHGYTHEQKPSFDVSKWVELWRRGINLWRLKPFDDDGRARPIRVIYAYIPLKRRYVVLGIVPRDCNTYDTNDERSQRILTQYAEL